MHERVAKLGRVAVVSVAVLSPVVSHLALATGAGAGFAAPIAVLQAAAVGMLVWGGVPRAWRAASAVLAAALLAALAVGAATAPAAGLLASAGLSHALLYAGLLALFGATLWHGRTPMVTRFARRINPDFHAGMEAYTRGATIAWCCFFAGQIAISLLLLWLAPGAWRLFVTILNLPLVGAMAVAEVAARRHFLPGQKRTSVLQMIRGVRASGLSPAEQGQRQQPQVHAGQQQVVPPVPEV